MARKAFFKDYVFNVMPGVYEPAEDSLLFAENLRIDPGTNVLDLGTGCGILGIVAAMQRAKVVATDLSPSAVFCAKINAKLNHVDDEVHIVRGDMFTPLVANRLFDLILFNAPYLPLELGANDPWLERSWSGCVNGELVIDRFVHEIPRYLKPGGRVMLMISSITGINRVTQRLEDENLKANIVAEKNLPFFETLALIEAKLD